MTQDSVTHVLWFLAGMPWGVLIAKIVRWLGWGDTHKE